MQHTPRFKYKIKSAYKGKKYRVFRQDLNSIDQEFYPIKMFKSKGEAEEFVKNQLKIDKEQPELGARIGLTAAEMGIPILNPMINSGININPAAMPDKDGYIHNNFTFPNLSSFL